MAYYAYHRVSAKNQHEDRGVAEIEVFCKQKNITLSGDTLIITEMDRLGRNKAEILKALQFFRDRGVYVIILEIPTTQQDYSHLESSMAKMMMETINNMLIEMYAVFAQLEIEKKEKRQREGINSFFLTPHHLPDPFNERELCGALQQSPGRR